MRIFKAAAMAALALGLTAGTAIADSFKQGDLIMRGRGIMLAPTSDSNGISPDLLGGGLEAKISATPELDFTYMITDNIGVELILATSKHSIDAIRGISGVGRAAEAWLLPPTLLAQYHFDTGTKFKPYIGAGINYTIVYGTKADANLNTALGGKTSIIADSSIGPAAQIGFDYMINDKWMINVDAKYARISSDLKIKTGAVVRRTSLDINPIVVGIGVGYRF